jgi:sirohydrochlorin ferrochelatase
LLCSHGIYGGPGVSLHHAELLHDRLPKADIDICCLLGSPNIADALPQKSGDLTIIPVLMADGFTMNKLRETVAELRPETDANITITSPIGAMPDLTDLLVEVALASCLNRGWKPEDTNFLLAAHGSKRIATTSATTLYHLERIEQQGLFAGVEAAFLDQKPYIDEKLATWHRSNTVMVGLFTDAGPHGKDDLQDLANKHGKKVEYTGPIGTHQGYADLIASLIETTPSPVN